MIEPAVRAAQPEDIAQLILLEREARQGLVGKRGGDRWLADHPARGAGWDDAIRDATVLVGIIGDVVVGYLVGQITADGRAEVVEPFVAEQARHNGFGDMLLGAFIDRAQAAGAVELDGEALPGDRETKNMYERAGIKARLIVLATPLPIERG